MVEFININDYKAFEELREQQLEVIPKIIDCFKSKKFFILEAPPGSGKSGISLTVANYFSLLSSQSTLFNGTYITTHQKILQDQYINENWYQIKNVDNVIDNIKSSENYICDKLKNLGVSCGEVSRFRKKDSAICEVYNCSYIKDRKKFIEGKIGITNIQYFLNLSLYTKILPQKYLMVCDEAHSLENNLLNFISIDLSEWIANIKLKLKFPKFTTNENLIDWVKNVYVVEIEKIKEVIDGAINKLLDANKSDENQLKLKTLFVDLEFWNKHLLKLETTLKDYNPDLWVIDKNSTKTGYKVFSFKPIIIDKYAEQIIFNKADKFLLMSATILNKKSFCKSLGIPVEETEFISLPSPFDKKNRLVHYMPVGKMSQESLSTTLPVLAKTVDLLLQKHYNVKGIIHTNSYAIANYISNNVPKNQARRFLTHTSSDRDEVLNKHLLSKNPTILLTPSMTEGVDLKDDSSRLQIICKIPFPYLGDERIILKKKKQSWWYAYTTAKILIQALGRSTRTETDFSTSYILDASWESFFRMNSELFPEWFTEALV